MNGTTHEVLMNAAQEVRKVIENRISLRSPMYEPLDEIPDGADVLVVDVLRVEQERGV